MRTYAEPPATFVRGQGTMLYDADDRAYLDFITGLAVVSLGHGNHDSLLQEEVVVTEVPIACDGRVVPGEHLVSLLVPEDGLPSARP